MIKKALIESVKKSLAQIDKTTRYHDKLVEAYITMATNTIMEQIFAKDIGNFDLYARTYTNVAITEDVNTGEFYSLYPAPIVQTIDVAKGVRSISTMRGWGLQFAPVAGDTLKLFEGLDIVRITDVVGYRLNRDRITYMGRPVDEDLNTITTVKMSLVVPFTEYDDDENFHIPGGFDLNLFDAIVQIARGIPPKDLLNDESNKNYERQ